MKLKDKIVLVTGASKGIGRALAVGLAREGAHVVVNFNTDPEGADATVSEIVALDRKALSVQADVGQVSDVQAMFETVLDHFGRLDVLVNNAAITGWGDLFSIDEEKWDQIVDTNLKGTFFCSQQAARIMKEAESGSIINISTNCAELGVRNLVAYATSKAGIHGLTKQLAVALAPHKIRVNAFGPGPTLNERNLRDDPNYEQTWSAPVPMGRPGRPEEMVGAAVFLASDDSVYMTGQVFFVDGGWSVAGRLPEAYFEKAADKNK